MEEKIMPSGVEEWKGDFNSGKDKARCGENIDTMLRDPAQERQRGKGTNELGRSLDSIGLSDSGPEGMAAAC